MCDEGLNHGMRVRDVAHLMGNQCCGSTMSNVCSGQSDPDPDLCQVRANFLADRIHSVECVGVTEDDCQQLGGRFEAAQAGEGGCDAGQPRCSEVISTATETAEALCAGKSGTVRDTWTCNHWTADRTRYVGRFNNASFPCGGFVMGRSINVELFAAGDACCSDQTPVCRGQDVHEVSGSMTLNLTSVLGLSDGEGELSDAAQTALKDAIAAQIDGVDPQDVGNIEVVVKVKGTAPMQVANAAAFVASAEAKQAVEAGLAAQAGVEASRVTATLSVAGAVPAGNATEETTTANTTANTTGRRLQDTVNVEYEIEADLSNSDMLTTSLRSADASALTTEINAALAEVEGDFDVTVDEISADSEVTISYQIRTTDLEAATAAEAALTAAATDETAQTSLMDGLNTALRERGVDVQVNSMTVAQPTREVEDTGDAATTPRPTSNGAFSFGPGGLLIAASAVFQQAQF